MFNQLERAGIKVDQVLFGVLGLLMAAKAAEPPEDATDLERNRYKFWAKAAFSAVGEPTGSL